MTIAIFSHRRAVEADRVVKELARRGARAIRVNTGHLEATAALHVGSDRACTISCDGRMVRIDEIHGAWLHQLPPGGPGDHASPLQAAGNSSRRQLWDAAVSLIPDESWLTAPVALRLAGNKFHQARFAEAAGCPVPVMALTNDPAVARHFASDRAVMKYAGESGHLWQRGKNGHAAVAVEANLSGIDDETVVASPAIFQDLVSTVEEIRVVAIAQPGHDPVAFAAAGNKPRDMIDIRLAEGGTSRYTATALPPATVTAMGRMMSALGVGFCSADLLLDAEGTFWFVDLNATGAWWWIDDLYERQVTDAISTRLETLAR